MLFIIIIINIIFFGEFFFLRERRPLMKCCQIHVHEVSVMERETPTAPHKMYWRNTEKEVRNKNGDKEWLFPFSLAGTFCVLM